jgi:hypothetical protein
MGQDKKKFRTTCHLTLIKKNVRPHPIKVETKKSPPLRIVKKKGRYPLKILKNKIFYYNHIIIYIIIALSISKDKKILIIFRNVFYYY